MNSVTFDDSFINRVYINPANRLASYDAIWKEEIFTLVRNWHKNSGTPLDHTGFKDRLRSLIDQNIEDRRNHPVVKLRDKIMSRASNFQKEIFQRIALLLPPDTPINAVVSLVSLIIPGAFCVSGKIIVNLSNPQFLGAGDDFIFNIISHELYHFGFHSHQRDGSVLPSNASPKEAKDHIFWWLQNEGMATFASYNFTDTYPDHGVARDYEMLNNITDIRSLTSNINEILNATTKLPIEALREMLWKKGVKERAFYVVGANMARIIDQEKGRKTLISLIKEGPRCYAETYNNISPKDMRINL